MDLFLDQYGEASDSTNRELDMGSIIYVCESQNESFTSFFAGDVASLRQQIEELEHSVCKSDFSSCSYTDHSLGGDYSLGSIEVPEYLQKQNLEAVPRDKTTRPPSLRRDSHISDCTQSSTGTESRKQRPNLMRKALKTFKSVAGISSRHLDSRDGLDSVGPTEHASKLSRRPSLTLFSTGLFRTRKEDVSHKDPVTDYGSSGENLLSEDSSSAEDSFVKESFGNECSTAKMENDNGQSQVQEVQKPLRTDPKRKLKRASSICRIDRVSRNRQIRRTLSGQDDARHDSKYIDEPIKGSHRRTRTADGPRRTFSHSKDKSLNELFSKTEVQRASSQSRAELALLVESRRIQNREVRRTKSIQNDEPLESELDFEPKKRAEIPDEFTRVKVQRTAASQSVAELALLAKSQRGREVPRKSSRSGDCSNPSSHRSDIPRQSFRSDSSSRHLSRSNDMRRRSSRSGHSLRSSEWRRSKSRSSDTPRHSSRSSEHRKSDQNKSSRYSRRSSSKARQLDTRSSSLDESQHLSDDSTSRKAPVAKSA